MLLRMIRPLEASSTTRANCSSTSLMKLYSMMLSFEMVTPLVSLTAQLSYMSQVPDPSECSTPGSGMEKLGHRGESLKILCRNVLLLPEKANIRQPLLPTHSLPSITLLSPSTCRTRPARLENRLFLIRQLSGLPSFEEILKMIALTPSFS